MRRAIAGIYIVIAIDILGLFIAVGCCPDYKYKCVNGQRYFYDPDSKLWMQTRGHCLEELGTSS